MIDAYRVQPELRPEHRPRPWRRVHRSGLDLSTGSCHFTTVKHGDPIRPEPAAKTESRFLPLRPSSLQVDSGKNVCQLLDHAAQVPDIDVVGCAAPARSHRHDRRRLVVGCPAPVTRMARTG